MESPHNILATFIQGSIAMITLAQIAEAKKLVEPVEVSIEKED
jgi:hypothetical protein